MKMLHTFKRVSWLGLALLIGSWSQLNFAQNACTYISGSKSCIDATPCKTVPSGETACLKGVALPAGAISVPQTCWQYQHHYSCSSQTQQMNTCGEYEKNPNCTIKSSTCNGHTDFGGKPCNSWDVTYQCKTKDGTSSEVTNCGGQLFCADGKCFDTGYTPDADFAKTATIMEGIRQAGTYFDPNTMKIFNGTASECRKTLGDLGNCCNSNPNSGMSNGNMAAVAGTVIRVGGEAVRTGSAYVYDALFLGDSGSNFMAQGAQSMFGTGNPFGEASFSSSFNFYGASFSMGASGFEFVSFDPYSFAAQVALKVVIQMLSCEQAEKVLAMKRGNNLCEYMGSWCSQKIPVVGTCIQRKEKYCCYNSKLAKMINVQGRAQVGKGWGGAPENPDCSGFTATELEKLDFSKMDLSEFYADLVKNVPDVSGRQTKNTAIVQKRINNYYQSGQQGK